MSAVARRYYDRGRTSLSSGDLASAQEELRNAVELAPSFNDARMAFAVALARGGDSPRAAQVLRVGLARPCSPIAAAAMWCTLGDVLTLGGDFFGAEEAFGRAAQTPGFDVRVASGLARVYGRLGRFGDLAAALCRAGAASAGR